MSIVLLYLDLDIRDPGIIGIYKKLRIAYNKTIEYVNFKLEWLESKELQERYSKEYMSRKIEELKETVKNLVNAIEMEIKLSESIESEV